MKKPPLLRRGFKWLAWLVLAVLGLQALLVVVVSFPYPAFPHRQRHEGYLVYSDEAFDFDVAALLDEVDWRREAIEISPMGEEYRILFVESDRLYSVLTRLQRLSPVAQGYSHPHTGSVVVSLPNIERIRSRFGPELYRHTAFAGVASQVITHELVHVFIAAELGLWRARSLPDWKREGYCEFASNRRTVLADPEYDSAERVERAFDDGYLGDYPIRQHYYRSHILVEYLLVVRGLSFADLMEDEVSWDHAWAELRRWYGVVAAEAVGVEFGVSAVRGPGHLTVVGQVAKTDLAAAPDRTGSRRGARRYGTRVRSSASSEMFSRCLIARVCQPAVRNTVGPLCRQLQEPVPTMSQ